MNIAENLIGGKFQGSFVGVQSTTSSQVLFRFLQGIQPIFKINTLLNPVSLAL